ncbi:MAG: DUF456 domain-containing protein, partial [Myxococcota bacterium]
MTIAMTIVFALLGILSLILVAVGLPGTWMLLAIACIMELADGWWLETPELITFGWTPLAISLVFALISEILEFATGAVGAKVGGGSNRGIMGAVIGGFVGAIAGTGFLPLIGTLIGALLGTFVGALAGEMTGPNAKDTEEALPAALAGAIGRIVGTVAKVGIGIAIWLGLLGAMIYQYFFV